MRSAMEQTHSLNPTLWRTCRALANCKRLEVLRHLLREGRSTVSDVAAATGVSVSTASEYLRALNARGLLDVRRTSRWVEYCVSPNESIPFASSLLAALRQRLSRGEDAIEGAFRDLTAFTHPRRIRIVRELTVAPRISFVELAARSGISMRAMRRHLRKLASRGLVAEGRDGRYSLRRRGSALAKTLIQLASGEE